MKRKHFTEKPQTFKLSKAQDLRHPNGQWLKINGAMTDFGKEYFAQVEVQAKKIAKEPWLYWK